MSTERDPPRLGRGAGVSEELARALESARGRMPTESVLSAVAARLPGGPGGGPGGGGTEPGGAGGGDAQGVSEAISTISGGLGGAGGAGLPLAAVTSVWPGVFLGAALGALVGGVSLFVPVGSDASVESAPAGSVGVAAPSGAGVASAAPGAVNRPASSGGVGAGSAPVGVPGESSPAVSGEASMPGVGSAPGAGAGVGGASASTSISALASAGAASASASDGAPGEPAEAEADYLRRAHAAISSSPSQALSLAEAHPARYPAGKLGQERELIVVSALAALGRTAEAEARARVFIGRYPGSAHQRRLQVLLPGLGDLEKNPSP